MVTHPPPTEPPTPLDPRTGRPIFYPQWLHPPANLVARNGRILRKSSLQNLARLRPCRCPREKFLLEQLAWQWWVSREPGRGWGFRRVGKLLGVSGQMIYRLSRNFRADAGFWRRRFAPFPWATFHALQRAREETRLWRERGWLRNPVSGRRRCKGKMLRRAGAKSRKLPTCPFGADFPPPPKRSPRPAPAPVRQPDGYFYLGCAVVTRDAHGGWMGRNRHPFDPSRLSHEQLPLWARGLAFELPPPPPASGASPDLAPAPEKKPQPVRFARRRPRR
jgi:hypothetical protein